jgi:hypothetical protein
MAYRRYSIYSDRSGHLALHCAGFSWIAALSLPLWAVPRRLWLACLAWLAIGASAKALWLALHFDLPVLGRAGAIGIYIGVVLIEFWPWGKRQTMKRWRRRPGSSERCVSFATWLFSRRGSQILARVAVEPPTAARAS